MKQPFRLLPSSQKAGRTEITAKPSYSLRFWERCVPFKLCVQYNLSILLEDDTTTMMNSSVLLLSIVASSRTNPNQAHTHNGPPWAKRHLRRVRPGRAGTLGSVTCDGQSSGLGPPLPSKRIVNSRPPHQLRSMYRSVELQSRTQLATGKIRCHWRPNYFKFNQGSSVYRSPRREEFGCLLCSTV